jgi:hypothetical protein
METIGTWQRIAVGKRLSKRRGWLFEQAKDRFVGGVPELLRQSFELVPGPVGSRRSRSLTKYGLPRSLTGCASEPHDPRPHAAGAGSQPGARPAPLAEPKPCLRRARSRELLTTTRAVHHRVYSSCSTWPRPRIFASCRRQSCRLRTVLSGPPGPASRRGHCARDCRRDPAAHPGQLARWHGLG